MKKTFVAPEENTTFHDIRNRLLEILKSGVEVEAIDDEIVANAQRAFTDMDNPTLLAVLTVGYIFIKEFLESDSE